MSTSENSSPNQARFLDVIRQVDSELEARNIDYRIIGSLATQAYLEEAGLAVRPLDFNRPGAHTPDQQVPDIDLIIPRSDLNAARQVRESFLTTDFPVKIGLATPSTEIDFRPTDDQSWLTHRTIAVPVDSRVFAAQTVNYAGVDVRTLPAETLLHTYGAFGGMLRQKDLTQIKGLITLTEHDSQAEEHQALQPFHDYVIQRRQNDPIEYARARSQEYVESKIPRKLRNSLYTAALRAADVLGKR